MAEYINREAFIQALAEAECDILPADDLDGFTFDCVCKVVDSMPAASVAPVVRGWWDDVDSSYWRWTPSGGVPVSHRTYRCGRCGRGMVVKTSYCPSCGAKMDEKEATYD